MRKFTTPRFLHPTWRPILNSVCAFYHRIPQTPITCNGCGSGTARRRSFSTRISPIWWPFRPPWATFSSICPQCRRKSVRTWGDCRNKPEKLIDYLYSKFQAIWRSLVIRCRNIKASLNCMNHELRTGPLKGPVLHCYPPSMSFGRWGDKRGVSTKDKAVSKLKE